MGMSERSYDTLISMITKPYGIVLVVGPTGSGKTTTLHAALESMSATSTHDDNMFSWAFVGGASSLDPRGEDAAHTEYGIPD